MTPITLSTDATLSAWETKTTNADVVVNGITLTGMKAAAYLFGQTLSTIQFQDTFDGVQLTDGRFEFPPASRQWMSLTDVADALRYKYGVDPLIEFAPGLGVRGYSVADINQILASMNREFAGAFSLALLDVAAVLTATQTVAGTQSSKDFPSVATYLESLGTKATGLKDFYTARVADAQVRKDRYVNEGGYGAQITECNQLIDKYQGYLSDLAAGLDMIGKLRASANNSGTGFQALLDRYHTAGIPDVFSKLRTFDVDSTLLWDIPQVYLKYVSTVLSGGVGTALDWSAPGWNLWQWRGSPEMVAEIKNEIRNREDNFGFGEFDWNRWKAGTELAQVQSYNGVWSPQPIVSNLKYATLPGGYVDNDFSGRTVSALLNSTSTAVLAKATDTELRQDLTTGGDIYTDRFGAFYINGVPTEAQDVAVTTRMLVQENLSGQYKVLMDDMAERNNLIAASRVVSDAIDARAGQSLQDRNEKIIDTLTALNQQYGYEDTLKVLTAGTFSQVGNVPDLQEMLTYLGEDPDWSGSDGGLIGRLNAMDSFYARRIDENPDNCVDTRLAGYRANNVGGIYDSSISQCISLRGTYQTYRNEFARGKACIRELIAAAKTGNKSTFQQAINSAKATYQAWWTPKGDLFTWLRTFDVNLATDRIGLYGPTGLRWANTDGTTVTFSENNYSEFGPLNQKILTIDWALPNWGVTDAEYNGYEETRYVGNIPFTNSVDGTIFYGAANIAIHHYGLKDFMRQAESMQGNQFIASHQRVSAAVPLFSGDVIMYGIGSDYAQFASSTGPVYSGPSNNAYWGSWDWIDWQRGTETDSEGWKETAYLGALPGYDSRNFVPLQTTADFDQIKALLNTLISNKVRDSELDQAKLQSITAQLQTNIEAMTALIKAFSDLNSGLAQALR